MVGRLEIVVGQAVEPVVKGEPGILHGILCAKAAHPTGVTGGRTAENCYLPVALRDEVGDGGAGRSPVIHAHHREVREIQLVGDQRRQHRGDGDVRKALLEVRHAAAEEYHAFGLYLPQDLLGGVYLVGILVQVGDDAAVPVEGRGPLQLNEEVREEEVPGTLDHEDEAAGLLDLQLPGVGVWHEARLPHHLKHLFFRFGTHIRPVIDDAGDGADGTAAQTGNVFDGHVRHSGKHLSFGRSSGFY